VKENILRKYETRVNVERAAQHFHRVEDGRGPHDMAESRQNQLTTNLKDYMHWQCRRLYWDLTYQVVSPRKSDCLLKTFLREFFEHVMETARGQQDGAQELEGFLSRLAELKNTLRKLYQTSKQIVDTEALGRAAVEEYGAGAANILLDFAMPPAASSEQCSLRRVLQCAIRRSRCKAATWAAACLSISARAGTGRTSFTTGESRIEPWGCGG
jgi:hypothetical protein